MWTGREQQKREPGSHMQRTQARDQETFCKGLCSRYFRLCGPWGPGPCCNHSPLLLWCSSHRHDVSEWSWLNFSTTLFMDTEMGISCNFHIMWYCSLDCFELLKNIILSSQGIQKEAAGWQVPARICVVRDLRIFLYQEMCNAVPLSLV